MPEPAVRLPCPVCLGTTMEKVVVRQGLEVDYCRRCGGAWLERGEVQQLRGGTPAQLWNQISRKRDEIRTLCHDCHSPIDRDAAKCPACGWSAVLDCPDCGRPMRVTAHAGLRLDVCQSCKGVWFDHHELEAIWGASFDTELHRRNLPMRGAGDAGELAGDILLNTIFWAPDLVFFGAHAAGRAVAASAEALANLPAGLASAPEVASGAFEAVGSAASSVFEVIVEIISGIFDNF